MQVEKFYVLLETCRTNRRLLTALYACWQGTPYIRIHQGHLEIIYIRHDIGVGMYIYSRVAFCNGSFYDDSLLRPLSSLTEHSRLMVHHCRNSSVLSLLSAVLTLFRCARVSSYSILVLFFFKLIVIFPPTASIKKTEKKKKKLKRLTLNSFLTSFWTTAWTFFNEIKSDLIDFFQLSL